MRGWEESASSPPGTGPAWLNGDARGPRRLGGDVLKDGPLASAGTRGAGPCFAAGLGDVGRRTICTVTATFQCTSKCS